MTEQGDRRSGPSGYSWDRWVDPLVAVLVAALLLQSLLRMLHPPAWGYVLVAAEAVPLLWRRRFPLSTALVVGVFTTVYGLSRLPDPALPFAALVALYSAATFCTRSRALLVAAVAGVLVTLALLLDRPRADTEDALVLYLTLATAWLLGDSARSRREATAALQARAAELERAISLEAERAAEQERTRVARELHDVLAHAVSLMVVQAEAGPVALARDPQLARQTFETISATGKGAMVELRRLLGLLRSRDVAPLAPQPGLDQVESLVAETRRAGVPVDLELTPPAQPLPASYDLAVYRIVQEGLTNAVRHGDGSTITVHVRCQENSVEVEISNGLRRGAVADGPPGRGLIGIRERVAALGGQVKIGADDAGRWRVHAVVPTTAQVAR